MMLGSDELEQFVCSSSEAVEFKFGTYVVFRVELASIISAQAYGSLTHYTL